MTLDHLAHFAESQEGRVYRDTCERFGVDPAASLTDDVLAFQFRLALALAHQDKPADDAPQPDPFEEARRAAQKVKAMT